MLPKKRFTTEGDLADREKTRTKTDTMPPFETSFCSVCGSKSRKDPKHGDWCSKVKQKEARLMNG